MKYHIYQSPANDQWYWNLRASNGEIIAASAGEGYVERRGAEEAIKLVKRSNGAPVEIETLKTREKK